MVDSIDKDLPVSHSQGTARPGSSPERCSREAGPEGRPLIHPEHRRPKVVKNVDALQSVKDDCPMKGLNKRTTLGGEREVAPRGAGIGHSAHRNQPSHWPPPAGPQGRLDGVAVCTAPSPACPLSFQVPLHAPRAEKSLSNTGFGGALKCT